MKTKLILVACIALVALGLGIVVALTGAFAQEKEGGGDNNDPPSVSQVEEGEDCKTLAREISAAFGQLPGSDSVCSFQCKITAELTDTSLGAQSVNDLRIQLNRERLHVLADMFSMYRDMQAVVTVLPSPKSVYIYDVALLPDASTDPTKWLWMQDKVFQSSLVTECVDQVKEDGVRCKRVTFSPSPDLRRALNIKSFSMTLDVDGKKVREVSVIPARPDEYTRMTWALSDIRYAEASDDFRLPAVDQVLEKKHRLRSEYAGYALEDSRSLASADAER